MITKKYKNGFIVELVEYYPKLSEWYRNSEIETQDWIIDNAKKDWISLDCGAHLGYYAMLLSQLCPSGKVYAIEANLETLHMLEANLEHNSQRFGYDFSNIITRNVAIGSKDETLETTMWYTGRSEDTVGKTVDIVDLLTLDTFVETENLNVDFIKSDVDGWDYDLLLGAEKIMENQRPIIVGEINYALKWRNHDYAEVEDLLKHRNYSYSKLDAACPQNWLMIPNEEIK